MAKRGKLPKRIAGVRIPKKLRKRGAPLYALVRDPMVRNVVANMLAAGLLVAADAMAKQPKVKKTGRKAKRAVAEAGVTAGTGAANVGKALAFIAREGAHAIKSP